MQSIFSNFTHFRDFYTSKNIKNWRRYGTLIVAIFAKIAYFSIFEYIFLCITERLLSSKHRTVLQKCSKIMLKMFGSPYRPLSFLLELLLISISQCIFLLFKFLKPSKIVNFLSFWWTWNGFPLSKGNRFSFLVQPNRSKIDGGTRLES